MALLALAWVAQADEWPQHVGPPATEIGAKTTVSRVLGAVRSKDDADYEKVAKGAVFMAAPDFALPISRVDFEKVLGLCSEPKVASSRVSPKMTDYQLVRLEMKCSDKDHPQPADVIWDIMADNDRIFVILPGGIERVWPNAK